MRSLHNLGSIRRRKDELSFGRLPIPLMDHRLSTIESAAHFDVGATHALDETSLPRQRLLRLDVDEI